MAHEVMTALKQTMSGVKQLRVKHLKPMSKIQWVKCTQLENLNQIRTIDLKTNLQKTKTGAISTIMVLNIESMSKKLANRGVRQSSLNVYKLIDKEKLKLEKAST